MEKEILCIDSRKVILLASGSVASWRGEKVPSTLPHNLTGRPKEEKNMSTVTIVYGEPFEHVAFEDMQHVAWLVSLPSFPPFSFSPTPPLSLTPQTPLTFFSLIPDLNTCIIKDNSTSYKHIPDHPNDENQLSTGYPQNNSHAKSNCHKMEHIEESQPRFVPPTVDQVEAYIKQCGYSVVAGSFVSFYQSKGWMVGKNKMKDWKAALRTWEYSQRRRTIVRCDKTIEEQVKEVLKGLGNVD